MFLKQNTCTLSIWKVPALDFEIIPTLNSPPEVWPKSRCPELKYQILLDINFWSMKILEGKFIT